MDRKGGKGQFPPRSRSAFCYANSIDEFLDGHTRSHATHDVELDVLAQKHATRELTRHQPAHRVSAFWREDVDELVGEHPRHPASEIGLLRGCTDPNGNT